MDSKFKIFVIIALAVILTGMVAGGAFIVMKVNNPSQKPTEQQVVSKPKDIQVIQLKDAITTNLISEKDSKENHVIKVTVGFGINKKSKDLKEITKHFEEKELLIRDEVIQSLRDQFFENLIRSDAQAQLSEIITSRVSSLLGTDAIENVYFGEFFVQ